MSHLVPAHGSRDAREDDRARVESSGKLDGLEIVVQRLDAAALAPAS